MVVWKVELRRIRLEAQHQWSMWEIVRGCSRAGAVGIKIKEWDIFKNLCEERLSMVWCMTGYGKWGKGMRQKWCQNSYKGHQENEYFTKRKKKSREKTDLEAWGNVLWDWVWGLARHPHPTSNPKCSTNLMSEVWTGAEDVVFVNREIGIQTVRIAEIIECV